MRNGSPATPVVRADTAMEHARGFLMGVSAPVPVSEAPILEVLGVCLRFGKGVPS